MNPAEATISTVADCGPSSMAVAKALKSLFKNWSIEVTPREALKHQFNVGSELPAKTEVYVTWLRGSSVGDTVSAAAMLRRCDLEPVPHIAARALADESTFNNILARLAGEAAVKKVLLIGGALTNPVGNFDSSIRVLQTGLFERHGIETIGVGAHPEGSPGISADALAEALAQKNNYARSNLAKLELTTQFCFDAKPINSWERAARKAGNELPVAVGLAGLAGVTTLLKHARNCGVGSSISVLLKQSTRLLRLASAVDPSPVVLELACDLVGDPASKISRIHLFPFGAFEATVRYARAIQDGRFELTTGNRLVVHQ